MKKAYLNTLYRAIVSGEPVDIRIGKHHDRLDRLLEGRPWAFISACNPGSVLSEDNAVRQARLIGMLDSLGYPHHPGTGIPLEGGWPPEMSLIVTGIGENEAIDIGRKFGQNAIVCGEGGEKARLVWIS